MSVTNMSSGVTGAMMVYGSMNQWSRYDWAYDWFEDRSSSGTEEWAEPRQRVQTPRQQVVSRNTSAQVYYAAACGHLATLCKLLSEGADPDWYNPEDGLTPPQIACLKGRAACVHRLLVAGADIFATGTQE